MKQRSGFGKAGLGGVRFGVLVFVGVAAVMAPMIVLAAGGGEGGFDSVVHGIESRYHTHATRIPMMWLISGVAGIATHGGVHGLHVAEIEHFTEPVDGAELNALVEQRVGKGWQRMIRETSKSEEGEGGEQTLIYAKPSGDRMGLLIVNLDHKDMNLVQVSVDPRHLDDEIGQFKHHHGKSDDGSDNGKQVGSEGD
ncbi:MAG TPA: hypothetical protein VHZ52_13305 [Acidobacteriaceae bacterium]|jgi:hypothetical protein|nr:hypothetical protein [Acidobacteriaceae bacterium]